MKALAFLACLLPLAPAAADEFRMKDGRVHVGEVVKESSDAVRVRVAAGFRKMRELTLRTRDIEQRDAAVVSVAEQIELFLEKWSQPTSDEDLAERLQLVAGAWAQRMDPWIEGLLQPYADKDLAGFASYRANTIRFAPWPGKRWTQAAQTSPAARAARTALDWLAAHQDDDGRIDADGFMKHDPESGKSDGGGGGHHGERVACGFDGAVTGLAMLGWMASGSTPVSGSYRAAIAKALPLCRSAVARGPRGFDQIWNHAFCVQALAEAYWLGRDASLRPVLVKAVSDLLALQRKGGWRYIPRAAPGVPTSAAVGTALGMCMRVGIPVPKEAIDAMVAYFDDRVDPGSGRSEYHDGAERLGYTPTRSNTAAALVACAFVAHLRKRPRLSKQFAALTRHKPTWKLEFKEVKTKDGRTVRAQIGYLYPYAWYYTDLALQLAGKQSGWRGALRKTLLGAQRKDGPFEGSWDPKGTYSSSGGRAFVTALGALMLLSPVRYDRF